MLLLRGVEGQRPYQVGHLAVGLQHDVLHGRAVGHRAEVFGEVSGRREAGRATEARIGDLGREHTVERIDRHALMIVGQHVPPLAEQLDGVGVDGLRVRLAAEFLIAHRDGSRLADGLQDHGQELVARRHILEDDTVLDGRALPERQASGERRELPLLRLVALNLVRVADKIAVLLVALDDESEHVEDVVTIFVEAAAWQGIALGNLFRHPEFVHVAERQLPVLPENVHDPDTMLKLLSCIH